MLGIHKPGQGYWTRLLSALGFGAVVAAGAMWLFTELKAVDLPQEYHYAVEAQPEGLSEGAVANLYLDDDGDRLGGTAPVLRVFENESAGQWVVVMDQLTRSEDENDATFSTVASIGPQLSGDAGAVAFEVVERNGVETINRQLLQGGAAIGVILLGALGLLYFCYANTKTVDFLIATEGEMKKVNWSSRREVIGSTWVVISVSVLIAVVLLAADVLFSSFFSQIGVLQN